MDKEGPQTEQIQAKVRDSNVRRLPRDWLGPRDELVPFGATVDRSPETKATPRAPDADPQDAPVVHPIQFAAPLQAADFWGEGSAALQHPVQASSPGDGLAAPDGARRSGPIRKRLRDSRRVKFADRRPAARLLPLFLGSAALLAITSFALGWFKGGSPQPVAISAHANGSSRTVLSVTSPPIPGGRRAPASLRSSPPRHVHRQRAGPEGDDITALLRRDRVAAQHHRRARVDRSANR